MADDDEDGFSFGPGDEWSFDYRLVTRADWENTAKYHTEWLASGVISSGFEFERVWVSEDRVFMVSSGTLHKEGGDTCCWLRIYERVE